VEKAEMEVCPYLYRKKKEYEKEAKEKKMEVRKKEHVFSGEEQFLYLIFIRGLKFSITTVKF